MIPKRLKLALHLRGMNLEGELTGAIANNGKWWIDFQNKLRDLGFTVEQVPAKKEG